MGMIHICAPKATAKHADRGQCPDCKRKTIMLGFFTPWYGVMQTCIRCGRQFGEGEWIPLPFCRGGRERNIEAAKKMWRKMPPVEKNHYGLES